MCDFSFVPSYSMVEANYNKAFGIIEEKRGTTFRSSADEIFETLTWNNKTR